MKEVMTEEQKKSARVARLQELLEDMQFSIDHADDGIQEIMRVKDAIESEVAKACITIVRGFLDKENGV